MSTWEQRWKDCFFCLRGILCSLPGRYKERHKSQFWGYITGNDTCLCWQLKNRADSPLLQFTTYSHGVVGVNWRMFRPRLECVSWKICYPVFLYYYWKTTSVIVSRCLNLLAKHCTACLREVSEFYHTGFGGISSLSSFSALTWQCQ